MSNKYLSIGRRVAILLTKENPNTTEPRCKLTISSYIVPSNAQTSKVKSINSINKLKITTITEWKQALKRGGHTKKVHIALGNLTAQQLQTYHENLLSQEQMIDDWLCNDLDEKKY